MRTTVMILVTLLILAVLLFDIGYAMPQFSSGHRDLVCGRQVSLILSSIILTSKNMEIRFANCQ